MCGSSYAKSGVEPDPRLTVYLDRERLVARKKIILNRV